MAPGSVKSYQVNSNSTINKPGKFQWSLMDTGSDTEVTTVTIISDSFEGVDIYAIRVGDRVLVDHPSVGTDGSGNGVDYLSNNLAVGKTDETCSRLASNPGSTASTALANAFNGTTEGPYVLCSGGAVPANGITINARILGSDNVYFIGQSDLATFDVSTDSGVKVIHKLLVLVPKLI